MEQALAQATIPAANERVLAERLKPGVGDIPVTVNPTPPSLQGWRQNEFLGGEWPDRRRTRQISATLQYVTPHVYEWVEDGIQTNLNDIKRSADLFESKTYPTDREFFGSEWTPGMDNDVHLSILYANESGRWHRGRTITSADEVSHLVNPLFQREGDVLRRSSRRTNPVELILRRWDPGARVSAHDPLEPGPAGDLPGSTRECRCWQMHINGFDVGGSTWPTPSNPIRS